MEIKAFKYYGEYLMGLTFNSGYVNIDSKELSAWLALSEDLKKMGYTINVDGKDLETGEMLVRMPKLPAETVNEGRLIEV